MSLQSLCTPRESVFAADRRATVLSLDAYLQGKVEGESFFEENYFTTGMTTLVDRALRHLSGAQTGSSVFLLSQSMGGGKTHSMIALGLLAQSPELRTRVLGDENPAPNLEAAKVIGFNGRNSDAPGGIWGALAEQLGKADLMADYCSPLLKAPGPEAWRQLLGEDPIVLFLDELPPYLENAVAVPVGNGDLGLVTTTALANLFVAVAEMNNVCLVLSDLAGANYSRGQGNLQNAFDKATQGITGEAQRIAVPITPVNPNGDELYHILRKRLFASVGDESSVETIASGYRDALKEANNMGLTSTSPETLYTRIKDAYPFHPDLRELVGKFKENDGFQQTRGVIRLMQMIVSSLWNSKKAETIDLIHPYDLDLNDDEIASEIRTINPSLSEAIAHDIAHGGDAECEEIDLANKNSDASDAAKLVLMASLSTTPGAIPGLREYELIDCLQRPGRDLSTFKTNVLDKFATRAWYLHNSADGRLFFKNQQNLAAKLRSTAQSLHVETVDRMLREHLEDYFRPTIRDCYQTVKILPPLDEVQLEVEKTTLVIIRPVGQANQLPISQEWQDWWDQQQYKNRVLFLSGSKDTYQRVLDSARQTRALQSIEDELKSEQTAADDPQWRALDALRDRIALQFSAALKEAFDQIVYPSINSALRGAGIDLSFSGNKSGEATIRNTLEGAQKFTTQTDADAFRSRAEARLFGGGDVVLWSDFKRAAAVQTNWPIHSTNALENLKTDCFRKDQWREEGNHVRKGPFPEPDPEVLIRELSVSDEGVTYLKVEPLHASAIVYETGDNDPTKASSPVETPTNFEAKALRYRFLAYDPDDMTRQSEIKSWSARLTVKYDLADRGDHKELTLQAQPKANGIVIKYTTEGSSPTSAGAATYDGPIRIADNCRVVCAVAISDEHSLNSDTLKVQIPKAGDEDQGTKLDKTKPVTWTSKCKLDDSGSVWEFIGKLQATAFDINITAESEDGDIVLDYAGSPEDGYTVEAIKELAEKLQSMVGTGGLRMTVGKTRFGSGQELLDWLKDTQQKFDINKVTQ